MLVACTRRSSAPELSFLRPVATTVTAVTSITPMVSASAVTAVRPGLRMALRRASEPAAPPTAAEGRPTRPASPRTPRANRPGVAACVLSRSAATGAIFVARRAGIIAASTVASVPTSRLTTIVRVATTIPSVGSSAPTAVNRAFRPSARTMPTPMPAADASRPIVSASSSTAPRTWRRDAPTIRSSPNSFVRWATVIESELKIVNAADEHGDRREREQDRAQDAHERVEGAEREAVILGGGPDLRARTESELARSRHEDAVVAILGEQRPCCLQVEDGGAGLAERLHAREVGDAGERERLRLAAGGDLDLVADGVVLRLRGGAVDHDLARPGGPAAVVQAERGEPLGARGLARRSRHRSTGPCRPACRRCPSPARCR